jgi:hypothetical protein
VGVTHFASVLQLLAAALAGMLFVTCGASKVDAQSLTRTVQTGEVPWDDGVVGQGVPVDGVRPTSVGVLRSLRAPVSVHVVATGGTVLVQDVLGWAERALDALEFVHGFGQPLPDGDRGGDGTLDLYLVADGAPLEVSVDRLESDPWDRASAFVRIRTNDADPATLRRRVTEGIARAIVLGAKADHPPAFVAAAGASLARMVTGEPADPDAVRAFQREPSRAVFGTWRGDDAARGAGLFLDLVAARWDDDAHKLVRSLIVAPALRTPLGWHRLWDEPDVFDIARRMFRDEPGKLEGVLADFSVARAVLGTRADHDRLAGRDDSSYALRPMRVVRSADFPAWVVAREALEPTGCAVVELDLDDAPLRATTAVWFHGSPWQRWVLRAVRIRGDGTAVRDLGSDVIADGEWSLQLDLLDGYTRVLFVVTNLGDLSYDPDVPQSANGFFAMHFAHGGR